MSAGIHQEHCSFCFTIGSCSLLDSQSDDCPILPCINPKCNALMHQCKLEDHLLICLQSQLPCINADYGCDLILVNEDRGPHLEKCVASTVACKASYCRQVLQRRQPDRDSSSNFLPNKQLESIQTEKTPLDLHGGLFQFHQKLEYENTNSDGASDVNGNLRSSVSRTKVRNRALAKKKCVTCAKLGVICMYDLEQQNRKPFWVEARSHFDGPSSKRQSDRILSPDVFDGPRMHPEMRTQSRRYAYFDCSKVVRRDEFASHYMLMHNLIFEFQPHRCPMWATGCTFARSRLRSVNKLQVSFDSLLQVPKVGLKQGGENSTQINIKNASMLTNLPEHLMLFIFERLDSLSLKFLSQTCRDLRYSVIDYAEQRDRGIVLSTWVPSEVTDEQEDEEAVTWKFCLLSHENDLEDEAAGSTQPELEMSRNAADLTFSTECFVPTNSTPLHQLEVSSFGGCLSDVMTDSVALVNPQISRFCTYSGTSYSEEMRRHLECCEFVEERANYKEHMHYDLEGRIPLPMMRQT